MFALLLLLFVVRGDVVVIIRVCGSGAVDAVCGVCVVSGVVSAGGFVLLFGDALLLMIFVVDIVVVCWWWLCCC